jgi:hypothetical protein
MYNGLLLIEHDESNGSLLCTQHAMTHLHGNKALRRIPAGSASAPSARADIGADTAGPRELRDRIEVMHWRLHGVVIAC